MYKHIISPSENINVILSSPCQVAFRFTRLVSFQVLRIGNMLFSTRGGL